jgi:recombination protein RecA
MSKKNELAALEKIEDEYGKGTILKMDDEFVADIEAIPTGIPEVDDIMGIGGFPIGRIVDLFGAEGSGKTTLALHGLKQALKQDKICVFVDAEHSLNTEYAKNMGIDLSDVYIYQPTSAEEAFDIINLLIEDADYIIVDSMPALVPKKELEGKAEDQNVGLQARIFSKELRKLQGKVRKADTSVVCINQMRDKIDGSGWGKSWKTTGGRALKFYSSIRLEVKDVGGISDKNNNKIGHKVRIQARKNKLAAPFKEVVVSLIYGRGIDTSRSWLSKAIKTDVITKNGSWYYYGEEKLGQGEDKALKFVRENKQKVREEVNEVTKQKNN